jgi:hypothetical protein
MPLTTKEGICETCGADRKTVPCPDCGSHRVSPVSTPSQAPTDTRKEKEMRREYDAWALKQTGPAPAAPSRKQEAALSVALAVIEWVEGGLRLGTDWRNGLAELIALRLRRFDAAARVEPTKEEKESL